MLQIDQLNSELQFPTRRDSVKAKWVPIYIEPVVGSGERITIGVAVAYQNRYLTVPVVTLERLACLYGKENQSLMFAAKAAMESFDRVLSKEGDLALETWHAPFEGVIKGATRIGAGNSLEEIARSGLMLCSSLVEKIADEEESENSSAAVTTVRLEHMIKDKVLAERQSLEIAFNRPFKYVTSGRATRIGFVGQRLVANFGLLTPLHLGQLWKDAKAKLWDLEQIRDDIKRPEFNLSAKLNSFELLVNRVRDDDPQYSEKQIKSVQETYNELEFEADRKEIMCRWMKSPDEIAKHIVKLEAA
jgi:hypothetical protein